MQTKPTDFKLLATVLSFTTLFALYGCGSASSTNAVFSDDFNRSNTASIGSSWSNGSFQVVGQKLKAFSNSFAFYNTILNDSAATVTGTFSIAGGTADSGSALSLSVRSTSNSTTATSYTCEITATSLLIRRCISSACPNSASQSITMPWTAGTSVTMTFRISGSTLSCSLSGSLTASIQGTNTEITSAGYAGTHIYTNGTDVIFLDDFSITRD